MPTEAPPTDRAIGAILQGVSPCYGAAKLGERPKCGCRRRIVLGFGRPVSGLYTVECCDCGAQSCMRAPDVERLTAAAPKNLFERLGGE